MSARRRPLYFGRNVDTNRRVGLDPKRLVEHTLIVGGTGSGKTVCLESIARQAIDNGSPLIFLDPKGAAYKRLVNYCRRKGITDRLQLIDPNDSRYRIGLNYFDMPATSITKKVGMVKEAIYRAMGRSDAELTITFERWGGAALSLLAQTGLTLADFHSVLVDEEFRQAAIERSTDAFVQQEWNHFAGVGPREQNSYLQASINRAALFAEDPTLHEMTGLPNAIDWQDVMNNRGIVLANLAPRNATEQLCRFIGIMLIHQIYQAGLARPQRHWKDPCYVIADEFADLICPDFKDALQKLREFGVALILALQNTGDLRGIDPNNPNAMLDSVLQNTETKLALKTRNYDEALFLARNIFGSEITGDEVKHTHTSAVPYPYEKDVETRSSSESSSRSSSSSSSDSGGTVEGTSQATTPGTELFGADNIVVMDGSSRSVVDSWSSSSNASESENRSEGRSVTTQQWTDYRYEQIPTFRSLDESFHRAANQLRNLNTGFGYLQYNPSRPAIRIHTYLPKQHNQDEQKLVDYTAMIFERMGALPPARARELIDARRRRLLSLETGGKVPTELLPEHDVEFLAREQKRKDNHE